MPKSGSKMRAVVLNAAIWLFLYLLTVLYLSMNIGSSMNVYDEGVRVYGTARVLNGDLPVRDFWTLYSPGLFLFYAGLFKVFGIKLIVARWANVLAIALVPVMLAAWLKTRTSCFWALLLSLIHI